MTTQIEIAKKHSSEKLDQLRKVLHNNDNTFSIVVGGSLSRGEASGESDLDYFFFGDDSESIEKARTLINEKQSEILEIIGKPPSTDGAFGEAGYETVSELITDIGGNGDDNAKITRRILFLLEGTWLTSEETFRKYRYAVLSRYVSDLIERRHLCRFLLNDIIRYYRTICVDFEFKTVERNKEWGLRYVKLRYSRQLLYFSGLVAIAETVGQDHDEKIAQLSKLFELSPMNRISVIFDGAESNAYELYDGFLKNISDPDIRKQLNEVTLQTQKQSKIFQDLRDASRRFTAELSKLLSDRYPSSHPIHNAIIF